MLQPLLEVACYYVGRIVVPLLSFGRLKCDRLSTGTSRKKLRWFGVFHRRGQQTYVSAEATALAGFIFIALIAGSACWFYFLRA